MSYQKISVPKDEICYFNVELCGVEGQKIFITEADYGLFSFLMDKYLSKNNDVDLLTFCLLPDSIDLILCQIDKNAINLLLHKIICDYNKYYFEKYGFEDILSESKYKICKIAQGKIVEISQQLHMKPQNWEEYPHSSLKAYIYNDCPNCLNDIYITRQYGSAVEYYDFMKDISN